MIADFTTAEMSATASALEMAKAQEKIRRFAICGQRAGGRRCPVATRDAMIFSLTVPLMVLHDLHGFGPKRLEMVCDEMIRKYKDLDAGLFTVDDANAWLWDYAGIRVEE